MRRKDDTVDRTREEQLARKRSHMLKGRKVKPEEVTVEVWLSGYRLLFPDDRSERTRRNEADMLRPFRREYGELKMGEVTAFHAQAWALDNPSHVRYLKRAWAKAVLFRVAPLNVWNVVEMPARTKERRRPPTDLELQAILRRARTDAWGESFADLIEVAAFTGAREGGLIALRCSAVDVAGGRLTVTEKGDKTRELVLTAPAAAAMARQLERVRERGKQGPLDWKLAWLWRDETPLTAHRVQKAWREVRGEFPHGFHALKHYAATWLAEQGVDPLDIAVQLGHTDAQGRPYERLVRRVYDHPDTGAALDRLQRRVS